MGSASGTCHGITRPGRPDDRRSHDGVASRCRWTGLTAPIGSIALPARKPRERNRRDGRIPGALRSACLVNRHQAVAAARNGMERARHRRTPRSAGLSACRQASQTKVRFDGRQSNNPSRVDSGEVCGNVFHCR